MAFWDKFKFKKKPFTEGVDESTGASIKPAVTKIAGEASIPKEIKTKDATELSTKAKKESSRKTAAKVATSKIPSKKKKSDTGDAYRILIKPIISEKITMLGTLNQYGFEVSPRANKSEIKKAIKNVYGVDAQRVRIINNIGKRVRFGRTFGKLKDRKKAIITLKDGDRIEVYEGV